MKKHFSILCAFIISTTAFGQPTDVQLSGSYNVFTSVGTKTQLWADPSLNTVMFIHRGDVTGNELFFDISTDGGSTWTLDQGPLFSSTTQRPRYPQAVLVNPSGVLNPDSAYVSFQAPLTSGSFWTGIIQGQQQVVSGSIPGVDIDSLNALGRYLLFGGYTVTPQGVLWSVDMEYLNGFYTNQLIITKGVWNSGARKFDYTTQFLNAGGTSNPHYLGSNIAFSPDGQTGYAVMVGNNGSIPDSVYYPVIFRTSDGGQSWNGPITIDVRPVDSVLNLGASYYTMGNQFDVAVDGTGTLHIVCEISESTNNWELGTSAYGHLGLFDIRYFHGVQCQAELITLPETFQGDFGIAGSTTDPQVLEYNRPQISINAAGDKLFFTWIDTDTAIYGVGQNLFPDFHVKGYDIVSQLWTSDINITEFTGNMSDGACLFNNVSYYVFTGAGNSTIPMTFASMLSPPVSTGSPITNYYEDGITIADAQFTLPGNPVDLVAGESYTFSGIVFYDANGNGIKDGTEINFSSQIIDVLPDGVRVFTNGNGDYSFIALFNGNTHVLSLTPYPGWMVTTDSLSYTVVDDTVNQSGFDFGVNGISALNNLEVSIAGGTARCGFPVTYWVTVQNTGTTIIDGRIAFILDTATALINSVPSPDIIAGDTLYYNFTNLYPFTSVQIIITLQMPLLAGDTLHFASLAQIDSIGTYYTLGENSLVQIVTCSYDPNDKTVSPEGFLGNHYTLFSDTLYYTIRFQNTGNDTAFTVVLRDTIATSLDLTTFHITGSSHEMNTTIYPNRVIEFRFENILLPDSGTDLQGSNGFVQYRIQPLNSITLPAVVNNTAYIYFDYNQPVQTNTVSNTLVTDIYVGIPHAAYNASDVLIVPNPFTNESEIILSREFTGKETRLRVMNVVGELVFQKTLTSSTERIYRGKLTPGIYFYEVQNSEGKRAAGKFVIQ